MTDPNKMKAPNFIASFNHAIDGIIHGFRNEINLRVHIISAVLMAIISLLFDLSRVEMGLLCVTIIFVIFAELINTAIEATVDLLCDTHNQYAKIAKDVAAGAVLIAAINALLIGYLIFYSRIVPVSQTVAIKIQNSPTHLTFIALILVVLITIILKSLLYRGRGSHLMGGTVSGHSATAFCAATIISLLANNMLITILAMGMGLLVAESRVEAKIHSISEVISGSILGSLLAVLIFRLLL